MVLLNMAGSSVVSGNTVQTVSAEGIAEATDKVTEPTSTSLAEPPAEAEQKKAQGNTAFQAKNFAEAAKLYGEAIVAAETAGAAVPAVYFSNRAVCRATLGDWAGAREDAAQSIERPGGVTKKALYQKARAEYKLGLNTEADETLCLAEKHGLRSDVEKLLKDDRPPTASTAAPAPNGTNGGYKAAPVPVAPQPQEDPVNKAKEEGNAKYKDGAYREALTEYERALELLPSGDERRAALLGNVAAACLMLRRVEKCIEACEQSLELDPSNNKIRARLAIAQVATGDFATARATLGSSPSDPALTNALKQIDGWETGLEEAEKVLSGGEPARALSLFADLESKALFSCSSLALRMGRCYLELKNYPRVLNTTQQVLRANPRSIDALILRSEALYRNNDASVDSKQWADPLEQGQKLLREALSFDPDHTGAQGLRKRLRLLCTKQQEWKEVFDNRDFEKAREVLDEMIEQCQDNPILLGSLYSERAKASMRLKDWRTVLKDVGQATYRNHTLVQPYLYRAQAMQALDRHEDAVKELESLFSWHREQSVYDKLVDAKFQLRKMKRANYYELLGVPSVASQLEIKKGYREKATEWHPDKKGHLDEVARKNAEEMFKRIGEAYEVLTDPAKKELYDKGYDLEGIEEEIQIKKQRTGGGGGCHSHGCRGGGCH